VIDSDRMEPATSGSSTTRPRPDIGWLWLRFANPSTEADFRRDYFRKSLRQVRISLTIGLILYAGFGVLDPHIIPTATTTAWWIRYAVVCPVLLATIGLSLFPAFERLMQPVVAAAVLVAGFGIIAMIVAAEPPGSYYYYAGLLLSCAFINTFMRLRFVEAAAVTWAIVACYEIIVFQRTPPVIYINNTFFLLTINFVTTYACYFMERSSRTEFFQRRTIEQQSAQLNQALQEVERARRAAEEQSRHDPLTDLFNRRYFFEILRSEIDTSRHTDAPLSVLMLDLDHFKRINDTYGHGTGDHVLRAVAAEIVNSLRRSDVPSRYGGEEFAILLTQTCAEVGADVARRIHDNIAEVCAQTPAGAMSVTVSVGVASYSPGDDVDADTLVDRADQALYIAKQGGRDRVCTWSPDLAGPGAANQHRSDTGGRDR